LRVVAPNRDPAGLAANALRRKAEQLVLPAPFRRQVGEASDTHPMRQLAIDGGCSELATDNRLVGSSSPRSPTTQSPSNRDFPVLYENPRIGGDSCAHFVSAGCRLDFRGRFGAFVSALQNRVSPRQRPVLVETWFDAESVRVRMRSSTERVADANRGRESDTQCCQRGQNCGLVALE
jgi:hypothetical protein